MVWSLEKEWLGFWVVLISWPINKTKKKNKNQNELKKKKKKERVDDTINKF